MNISYRIIIMVICLMVLSLEVMPICCATSGAVIVFERKNVVLGVDVGHVGIAFKNPNDGTWVGGAVEGTGDTLTNAVGVDANQYNGGWYSDVGFFKTKEDVIREFSTNRITESDGVIPHAAYDRMQFIAIQDPHYDEALQAVQRIPDRGFKVWANNDCLNAVYDVMSAYNVEGLKTPILSNWPKSYFNDLNGIEQSLTHEQQVDTVAVVGVGGTSPKAYSSLEMESMQKTQDMLGTYATKLVGSVPDFYNIIDARSFGSKTDAARYMNDMGVPYAEIQQDLSIIDEFGLENTGFCIVIVDINIPIFGETYSTSTCAICDENGDPIGYKALRKLIQS
jgi:hypothetical protein